MKTRTPLEQLKAEQQRLRQRCREERQLLEQEWAYLHANSSRLILSGAVDLLFPHRRKVQTGQRRTGFLQQMLYQIPYYWTSVRENFSLIWMLIRPFYLKWKKARKKKDE